MSGYETLHYCFSMAKVIICLVFLSCFIVAQCHNVVKRESLKMNNLIDVVIKAATSLILATGQDQIPVRDLDISYKKTWFFASSSFEASEGWVKSLSTLQRTGDAIVKTNGSKITLDLSIGLGNMEIGYNHYVAKFMNIGPEGKLNAIVKYNSIDCHYTMTYNSDDCVTTLDRSNLDKFSGLDIHLTGLGPLNWFSGKTVSWILNLLQHSINNNLGERLTTTVCSSLAMMNICKNIPV